MKSVAVIGSGVAGLHAAKILAAAGWQVAVFDKSRGPGGRLAAKRSPFGGVDFGAQYFTVESPEFTQEVKKWVKEGAASLWDVSPGVINERGVFSKGNGTKQRYVGTPRMTSISRKLEEPIKNFISYESLVTSVSKERETGKWILKSAQGETLPGSFHHLIINTPPLQALPFLQKDSELYEKVNSVEMNPCWAVSLTFTQTIPVPFQCAFVNCGKLSWIAKNNSKPQRGQDHDTWLLHGNASWSKENIEAEPSLVLQELTSEFFNILNVTPEIPEHSIVHRWRYSMASNPLDSKFLYDADSSLGICGDWLNKGKVEGAYMSGFYLAHQLLADKKQTSQL